MYPDANLHYPSSYTIKPPAQFVSLFEDKTLLVHQASPADPAHCLQLAFLDGAENDYYKGHGYQYQPPLWAAGPCPAKYNWFNRKVAIAPGVTQTTMGIHTSVAPVVEQIEVAQTDSQQDALMQLYNATNGASWKQNTGWGSGDFCSWYGLECNHDPPGTSQLISIRLDANGLSGQIPEAIFNDLPHLKVLQLSNNKIAGAVPTNLAQLPKLQMVHLQGNRLTGSLPVTMINLKVAYPPMQEIDLSYNQLTGEIPATLFGPENPAPFAPVISLKVFNLRYNMLSGSLPETMKNDQVLVSMLVGGNRMNGVISPALGSYLSQRKYCDMSGNAWTCPMPSNAAKSCQAICK
jgi:hypothetical protein